jgi:hypothetical protein
MAMDYLNGDMFRVSALTSVSNSFVQNMKI